MICTGHLHLAFSTNGPGFRTGDREIVAVHAGTCTSNRRRGEPNGYNRLIIDRDELLIQQRHWERGGWTDGPSKAYRRGDDGRWRHTVPTTTAAAS